MIRGELPQGRQHVGIQELDDGINALQLVLQAGARKNQGVLQGEALHGVRGFGVEVLDPLGLVQDHHIRLEATDGLHVPQRVVSCPEFIKIYLNLKKGYAIGRSACSGAIDRLMEFPELLKTMDVL